MKYQKQKHHRRSIRIPGYDYSQDGWYFVTICAQNKEQVFGYLENGVMILNEYGCMVKQEWLKTCEIRNNVELDEFVIMPNHFHGIIGIVDDDNRRDTARRAPAISQQFGNPVSGSLPTIIRSFKSAVTKQINEARQSPGAKIWQRNYWEHIVRDENDLNRIREYIKNNPAKWQDDKYFDG